MRCMENGIDISYCNSYIEDGFDDCGMSSVDVVFDPELANSDYNKSR